MSLIRSLGGVLQQQIVPPPAGDTIEYVGGDTDNQGSNTTNLDLTLPTHATDDVGIIFAKSDETGSIPSLAIATATGWTELDQTNTTTGRDHVIAVWYKVFTSASETNPSVTTTVSQEHSASVLVFRNVNTTTPIATWAQNDGSRVDTAAPAVTPTTANSALVLLQSISHDNVSAPGAPTTPSSVVIGPSHYAQANHNWQQHVTAYKLDLGAGTATVTPTAWTHSGNAPAEPSCAQYSLILNPA